MNKKYNKLEPELIALGILMIFVGTIGIYTNFDSIKYQTLTRTLIVVHVVATLIFVAIFFFGILLVLAALPASARRK